MYLTTRKILTDENGEGSNARALPCGVGGVGQSLRMCRAKGRMGCCKASPHAGLTASFTNPLGFLKSSDKYIGPAKYDRDNVSQKYTDSERTNRQ